MNKLKMWLLILLFIFLIVSPVMIICDILNEVRQERIELNSRIDALSIEINKLTSQINILNEDPIITFIDKPTYKPVKELTEKEQIDEYIKLACSQYDIDVELVQSVVYHESRYTANAKNGDCIGPMQVSKKWHSGRADKLGVTLTDTYGNILAGVDFLAELFSKYTDPRLVLMMYNMKHTTALELYRNGQTTKYVESVLARADNIREGMSPYEY